MLQISGIHPKHKLLTVDGVNDEDMVFVEDDFVASMDSVQPSLVQGVVHNLYFASKTSFLSLGALSRIKKSGMTRA